MNYNKNPFFRNDPARQPTRIGKELMICYTIFDNAGV